MTGSFSRRTVGIILLDDAGNQVLRWHLHNAWIARIEVSELDASRETRWPSRRSSSPTRGSSSTS